MTAVGVAVLWALLAVGVAGIAASLWWTVRSWGVLASDTIIGLTYTVASGALIWVAVSTLLG